MKPKVFWACDAESGHTNGAPERRRRGLTWSSIRPSMRSSLCSGDLRALGFEVVNGAANDVAPAGTAVRVLRLDTLDPGHVTQTRITDEVPTVVVLGDGPNLKRLLPNTRSRVDLALAAEPAELLAWRVERLCALRDGAERFLEVQRDQLTGLLNRRAFFDLAAKRVEVATPELAAGLVFLDLDRFKMINDVFGHTVGDQVLRQFSRFLEAELAPTDLIARIGGDEFVVLLTRYDRASIASDCQALVATCSHMQPDLPARDRYSSSDDGARSITVSAGLTFLDLPVDMSAAMGQADMAMYKAKELGRNRLVVADALQESLAKDGKSPKVEHFENVARVVTERVTNMITIMARKLIDEATRDANEDALTRLRNRRYLDEHLERDFEATTRYDRPLSVIFLDIDHFHDINMNFGWPSGDAVLRAFAQCLEGSVRNIDWCARYGGEEFIVVLPDTELDAARVIAERIRTNTEQLQVVSTDGRPIAVTASLGLASRAEDRTPRELIDRAAKATRAAKDAGRNRVVSL